MTEFMLMLRGSSEEWNALSDARRKELIDLHMAFATRLRREGRLKYGAPLSGATAKLDPRGERVELVDAPYAETKEALTGFYVIEARDFDEAVEIARDCPALLHGESVEVSRVGF